MEFEEGNIYFSKIIVIQSIPDEERQTGTEIHNDIIRRRAWSDPNLITEVIDVSSRSEFRQLIEKIKYETRCKKIIPFIHFETHGSKEGLILKSGEKVPFKEFIPSVRDINLFSNNNLFISIGACWGGMIQFSVKITEPCPFRGFIGPMDSIYPSDIIVSFTAFFNELLVSNDFEKAIKNLQLYNKSEVKFHHLNSEAYYDQVLKFHHKQIKENPTLKDDRIKTLVKKFWKNDPKVKAQYKTKGRLKKLIKGVENRELSLIYERLRDNFLHIK